jgi:hypothetical protein
VPLVEFDGFVDGGGGGEVEVEDTVPLEVDLSDRCCGDDEGMLVEVVAGHLSVMYFLHTR